jgi:CRISPR type III-B/RAMP module RAMP protein Cmr1
MKWEKKIEIVTPCFCRGAYQDTPEIRVPSVRGMVRWWFRALGGTADEEKKIFGGISGGRAETSRLVFRVKNIQTKPAGLMVTLPHKQGGNANPQAAFKEGAQFTLEVISRLGGLTPSQEKKVFDALEVWSLLGSIGLRSNRTGGNLWPLENAPSTAQELAQKLRDHGCRWPIYLASTEIGANLDALRKAATDTLDGNPQIFGRATGGRLSSPLKFKIVRLDTQLHFLIFAKEEATILSAKNVLKNKPSKPDTWAKISP